MRKKSIIDMSAERESKRIRKGKNIFKDGVNQRASIKQREIVKTIEQVMPGKVTMEELDLGRKHLTFEGVSHIDHLDLIYYTKNNLYSRIFELVAEMRFCAGKNAGVDENIQIGMKYEGVMVVKDITFIPLNDNDKSLKLSEELNNNNLLKDRILHLQALDFRITYDGEKGEWGISLVTGKGSVVWMLFPPVVQLTPLDKVDAVKMIEAFQLAVSELKLFTKRFDNMPETA